MIHPRELKAAFAAGENITALLRSRDADPSKLTETIETAYDLQSGSYACQFLDPATGPDMHAYKRRYAGALTEVIESLTTPSSLLEAGVGEGTTLSFVLDALSKPPARVHGFDVSWSRIAHCQRWLNRTGHADVRACVARLDRLPYSDACFDVVYTSHSIEPNGGNERSLLRELHRVCSRYLILMEPGYEFASAQARARMERLGYCRGLAAHAEIEGMRVIEHRLLGEACNPLNPTAITVIEKNAAAPVSQPAFACPAFGDPLEEHADSLYSPGSLRAYPKILGIPCLRPEDGVVASAYEDVLTCGFHAENT